MSMAANIGRSFDPWEGFLPLSDTTVLGDTSSPIATSPCLNDQGRVRGTIELGVRLGTR